MTLPPVIVEIQAEQATPDLVSTLLEACTRAVATTSCVQAGTREEQEQPTAVAIVTWVGPRTVQIQVGLREDRRWRVREIGFSPADERNEMWRSVGFATGTLVARASNPEPLVEPPTLSPPPPARPTPPTKAGQPPNRFRARSAPSPAPLRPEAPSAWTTIDWAWAVGPGLGSGAWRTGGMLRGSWQHPIGILATATLVESIGVHEHAAVNVSRTTLGIGAGYAIRSGAWAFELRAEGVAERLAVAAKLDQRTESGFRWVGGARVGVDGAWMPTALVGIVAGLNATWLAGSTDATLRGLTLGTEPAWSVGAGVGLRLTLR